MFEEYIYHGKKKLRCGYTTGSCAAAASKVACEMLVAQEKKSSVELMTPKGIILKLDVLQARINKDNASCAVKKDSGDDPDVTNGILVFSKAEKIPSGIVVEGGEGVGRVTKPGLDQPVGNAAINSVPRKMIESAVSEILEKYDCRFGIRITISVPGGAEIAKKTFNPRMGIEGGISVIGTTGIVEPMSSSALIETIRTEESQRRAEGYRNLVLTIGNYGNSFLAEKMPYAVKKSVMCSNFIGEAIDFSLEYGFESVIIIGHVGKLVKLGAGIMNTHSSQADGRMDVLVTCGVLENVDINVLKRIPGCVTVDSALDELEKVGMREKVCRRLLEKIEFYLEAKVKGEIKIGAVLFSEKYGIIGKTGRANEIIEKVSEEYNG